MSTSATENPSYSAYSPGRESNFAAERLRLSTFADEWRCWSRGSHSGGEGAAEDEIQFPGALSGQSPQVSPSHPSHLSLGRGRAYSHHEGYPRLRLVDHRRPHRDRDGISGCDRTKEKVGHRLSLAGERSARCGGLGGGQPAGHRLELESSFVAKVRGGRTRRDSRGCKENGLARAPPKGDDRRICRGDRLGVGFRSPTLDGLQGSGEHRG